MRSARSPGDRGIGCPLRHHLTRLASAAPGTVYLSHVGSASADHAALAEIIEGLQGQGLQPTTIARLVTGESG